MHKNNLQESLNDELLWGLPENISDSLIEAYGKSFVRFFGGWLYIASLIVGFAIGGFFLWPFLENLNESNAINAANSIDGLLYSVNFGFGLLVGLFVWILAAIVPVLLLIRVLPMPVKGALFFGVVEEEKHHGKNLKMSQNIMSSFSRPETAEEFINIWVTHKILKLGKFLAPLVFISAFISLWETQVYSVFTANSYERFTFFSGKQTTSWTEAESVQLGCNTTEDGSTLIYDVTFKSGSSVRVGGITVGDTTWIDAIETIDNSISKGGAQFKRWEWLKRDPIHSNCLFHYNRILSPEHYSVFEKILRLETL